MNKDGLKRACDVDLGTTQRPARREADGVTILVLSHKKITVSSKEFAMTALLALLEEAVRTWWSRFKMWALACPAT